jgi:hypothetical protein
MSSGINAETLRNVTEYDSDTYVEYNRSVQLVIQRTGPIVGAIVQYHVDFNSTATWTSIIDDRQLIRCYTNYSLATGSVQYGASIGNYTKCVRVGQGWSADNKNASFHTHSVLDFTTGDYAPEVNVEIFTSDKARFFEDGIIPPWLPPACLQPGHVPASVNCDWDTLFYTTAEDELCNRTQDVVTIEMYTHTNYSGVPSTLKLSVDFVAFLNFTMYQLDPSPLTNPKFYVQTTNLPVTGDLVKVDPSWVLAAWTVDNEGSLAPSRFSTTRLVWGMDAMMPGSRGDGSTGAITNLEYVCLIPIIQTLSLIDFTEENFDPNGPLAADARHPLLTRDARLFIWAYGFSSRTSKLGLVVVLAGAVVVIIQMVLGFVDRRKYRSPTQLLVAALEHLPSREFKEVENDDARVASVRFHVHGTMTNAGKFSFKKRADRPE